MKATQEEIDGLEKDRHCKHFRKLVGGGAVALVKPHDKINPEWVWRLRGGKNIDFPGIYGDRAARAFDTPRAFAESMGAKIDEEFEESLLPQYPVPRRREAVMATRAKL